MLLATIQGQWTPFDFAWTFMGVAAVGGLVIWLHRQYARIPLVAWFTLMAAFLCGIVLPVVLNVVDVQAAIDPDNWTLSDKLLLAVLGAFNVLWWFIVIHVHQVDPKETQTFAPWVAGVTTLLLVGLIVPFAVNS